MWLMPGGRLGHTAGAVPQDNEEKTLVRNYGQVGKEGCDSADCRERIHKEIRKEGEDEFRAKIEQVIQDTCQTSDYETFDEGVVENKEKEEQQAAVQQAAGQSSAIQQLAVQTCRDPGNFVIALVPDPVHTHLALQFDRTVEVIEEAAQDEGYVFDRAITPWDLKTHAESTAYDDRLQAELYQHGKEQLPGIVAFRGDTGHPDRRLFVLLVTETPTGGVRKQQFLHAIDIIGKATGKNLHAEDWRDDAQKPSLRVLGPSFSGSLDSLGILLMCKDTLSGQPKPCYPLVSVHSGSVSSRGDIAKFDQEKQKYNIHFVSLHESDDVMIERFLQFVAGTDYENPQPNIFKKILCFVTKQACQPDYPERGYAAREIAVLSEDETGYGQSGHEQEARSDASTRYCENRENRMDQRCFLRLYFPREISQLRAAYQEKLATGTSAGADARTAPSETLPSDFFVPGSNDDTVTEYSSKQMPLSQESVMLNLVAELRRHKIKFIILRATDPVDTLFLSRFLRTEYPQGRVVTIDGDLLLRREADDPRLHGVLTLSTYSLTPTANHNFRSFEDGHMERVFPGATEIGTYNAMRSLLTSWVTDSVSSSSECTPDADAPGCGCRHVLAAHRPSDELLLQQYGWLYEWEHYDKYTSYDAPPVKLAALGRDDFWPLASLGPFEGEKLLTTLPRVEGQIAASLEKPEAPPWYWRKVQLCGVIVCMSFALWLWGSAILAYEEAGPSPERAVRYSRAVLDSRSTLLLIVLTIFLVAVILQWPTPTCTPRLPPIEVPSSWRAVQLGAILLGLGFALSLWRSSIMARTQSDAKFAPALMDGRATLVLVVGLTLVFILLILQWPTVKNADPGDVNLDIYLHLTLAIVFVCTCWDLINRAVPGRLRNRWVRRKGYLWLALFVAGSSFLLFQVYSRQPDETTAFIVRYATLRAMNLTSGLSFIMPTFFFLTVWLWWADHSAAGYALLDNRRPRLPRGMKTRNVQTIGKRANSAIQAAELMTLSSAAAYGLVLVVFFAIFWWMGSHHQPLLSLERPILESAMSVFFTLALGGVLLTTIRLWTTWLALRKLLVALDSLALRRGFEAITGYSWRPIWRIGAGSLQEFQRIFFREKEALDCALNTYPLPKGLLDKKWSDTLECAGRARKVKHPYTSGWWQRRDLERETIWRFGEYQAEVSRIAGRALDFLATSWALQKEEKKKEAGSSLHDLGTAAWERFICLAYVNFLLVMLTRIRTLIVAVGGMYVLTMIGITQYPFEPKAGIQVILILLLAFIVIVVGLVFAQIHRDATLSYITDTKPGELGIDFWIRMASFTLLPLLSLLASQFPSVNRFFYSWLQPAIQALNR
jgi:hypothetical protein